ncbi:MAG: NADH-quinone oxidoreductase subunit C [Candidatus Acidiferrales bacterium]
MGAERQDVNAVVRKLREWDPQAIAETIEFRGEWTVVVPRERLLSTTEFLASDSELRFTYLSDITAVDRFPNEPRFELNYHLLSLERRERIRLKVRLPGTNPSVASVTSVWPGANWHECEAYDLMGVRFEGHPNLTRLLMPDDWEGHPLRKDYPVEGYR